LVCLFNYSSPLYCFDPLNHINIFFTVIASIAIVFKVGCIFKESLIRFTMITVNLNNKEYYVRFNFSNSKIIIERSIKRTVVFKLNVAIIHIDFATKSELFNNVAYSIRHIQETPIPTKPIIPIFPYPS